MANFVAMGEYYNANPYGLVKTVCRAIDSESGEAMICYCNIDKGGCCSEVFCMPEYQFKNIFIYHINS